MTIDPPEIEAVDVSSPASAAETLDAGEIISQLFDGTRLVYDTGIETATATAQSGEHNPTPTPPGAP